MRRCTQGDASLCPGLSHFAPLGRGHHNPIVWGRSPVSCHLWEWCSDWYGEYPKEAISDPSGPIKGSARVIRGGGWYSVAANCRSARRLGRNPEDRSDRDYGFRVALSTSEIPR
jgi:formylglycine-generating enzyme required for sulfatase activity